MAGELLQRSTLLLGLIVSLSGACVAQGSVLQSAYIKPLSPGAGDGFAFPMAAAGNLIVSGASFEDSSATGVNGDPFNDDSPGSGAAFVFERDSAGQWSQIAYLKSSNSEAGDRFGFSVAVSGQTVVIGAPFEQSNATGVNGNQADNSLNSAGAAYVFVRNEAGVWQQQAYLKASNTELGDLFGSTVAIAGDTIFVAANGEDSGSAGVNGDQSDNSVPASGAVYVFERDGAGQWSQSAYIKSSNPGFVDAFGRAISISGDTVAIGADGEASAATGINGNQADDTATSAGAAYVFVRDGASSWSQQAYLKAFNTDADDRFGGTLSLSGDRLMIGASGEDATAQSGNPASNDAMDSGAAYVFERVAGAWSQTAYLKAANGDPGDGFGLPSMRGGIAVISASGEDSASVVPNQGESDNSAPNAGAAYVFARQADGGWLQQAYLKAANAESEDAFGAPSLIAGSVVLAAPFESGGVPGVNGDPSDNSAPLAGAAYVFDFQQYSIGGTVAGLADGNTIRLTLNGNETLSLDRDGAFRFATEFEPGEAFAVVVSAQSQLPEQACTVVNGTSELGLADVNDVRVECSSGLGSAQAIDALNFKGLMLLILLVAGFASLAVRRGQI